MPYKINPLHTPRVQALAIASLCAAALCWPMTGLAQNAIESLGEPNHTPTPLHINYAWLDLPSEDKTGMAEDNLLPDVEPTPTAIRMTYESLKLPDGENMGMLAGNLLFDVSNKLRLGVGSYGAIRGERGGFITLGVEGEVQQRLSPSWLGHAGLFVGAGGGRGGYALSGGGLMLRGDVGLTYETAGFGNFGFGVSHVQFPSGVITSTQPYIQYEYPFHSLLVHGWTADSPNDNHARVDPVQPGASEFSMVARNYIIPSSAVRDNGQPQHSSMQLLGVEWLSYLGDRWFLKLESEGAMGGENNGYMQILAGGGYRLPITRSTAIKLHAAAGPAGGGGVDTGGGLLLDAGVSLQQNLTEHTALELSVGEVRAPSRSFEALSLALKLNYQFGLPNISSQAVSWSALRDFDTKPMRVRMANQTYFKADPQWRNRSVDQSVSNLGVQIDYFVSPHWFVTGQGLAAYAGNAGAYMTGQVGAGTQWPVSERWFVEGEALLGAAGGGGLAVGGGLVGQVNASVGYHLSNALSVMATAGRIDALRGDFKANVAGVSLAYQFTGFTAR
ncbi:MAG: hypothetical protein ACXW11_06935 [Methylotenera sp.]